MVSNSPNLSPRSRLRRAATEGSHFADFQGMLGIQRLEQLDDSGHECRLAGLVAGTQSGAVVAMKVLVSDSREGPFSVSSRHQHDDRPALQKHLLQLS
jgi:hypothetical protein